MRVVEAWNQHTTSEIDMFGVGSVKIGEFADCGDATLVISEHCFGIGKIGVDGMNRAVIEEFHDLLSAVRFQNCEPLMEVRAFTTNRI